MHLVSCVLIPLPSPYTFTEERKEGLLGVKLELKLRRLLGLPDGHCDTWRQPHAFVAAMSQNTEVRHKVSIVLKF